MDTQTQLQAALEPLTAGRARVRIKDGRANVVLDVTGLTTEAADQLDRQVKSTAENFAGVDEVRVAQTAEKITRRLIAVASGKGGVGKSTVSANLAVALARRGTKVGLVDADIYGPSQPMLFGVEGTMPQARDKVLIPVPTPQGVPMLSMGQLVAPGQAIAWRGPMVGGAFKQLVEGDWGDKDTLVLDLPPGTGDVQITMIQQHRPAGAVIVSTPQDLALIDARRAINLFEKAKIPIIGLVENMAGYQCPHCGEVSDPFGQGGAEAAAKELGIDFLGRIPLTLSIRTASDAGQPPAAGTGAEADAFNHIAAAVHSWLNPNGG